MSSSVDPRGKGVLAAVDIVIENTLMQHHRENMTKQDIAIESEPFLPQEWKDRVHDQAIAQAIGTRLRAAKIENKHGDEVRRFGCYPFARQKGDGKECVEWAWKAWKHMTDQQQQLAAQHLINKCREHLDAIKRTIEYINKEVRKPKGRSPMRLKWKGLNI